MSSQVKTGSASGPPGDYSAVILPEAMTRFLCNQRGCCCRGWSIPIGPEDVYRLAGVMPAEFEGLLPPRSVGAAPPDGPPQTTGDTTGLGRVDPAALAFAQATAQREQLVLADGPDDVCAFLEDAGTCGVHRRFGEAALPRICVNFPAVPYRVADAVELSFSTICPEVMARIAEGPGAYSVARLEGAETAAVAGRANRAVGERKVWLGEVSLPLQTLMRLRAVILAALDDADRPVLEVTADVSYALARLARRGDLSGFRVSEVSDRQTFYAFFSRSIWSHAPTLLATNLAEYARFVFTYDLAAVARDPKLVSALASWEEHYRALVLPDIPEWLLRRWLSHRYFTVLTGGHDELRFAYGSVVHSMALACRFMAGICGVTGRSVDPAIAASALSAADYFYRKVDGKIPAEAMPWFDG